MVKIGDRVTINRQKFSTKDRMINYLTKYEWLQIFEKPGLVIDTKDNDAFVKTEKGKWYFPLELLRVTHITTKEKEDESDDKFRI